MSNVAKKVKKPYYYKEMVEQLKEQLDNALDVLQHIPELKDIFSTKEKAYKELRRLKQLVYNRDVIIRRMQSEINELKARPTGIIPNQPLMYSWKPPTKGVTKATLVVLGILLFTASETMSYKEIYDKYVEERSNPFSPHYNPSKKPRESMFCETAQSSLINIYINNIRKYLRDYNITVQQKKVDGVRRYKLHEIDKLKLLELGGLPPKITLDLIKFNTPTEKAVNHDFKEAA